MIRVGTAELKAHMSQYLRLVQEGESIDVTSHRHSVAKLVPTNAPDAQGWIGPARPQEDLALVTPIAADKSSRAMDILLEDRRRR